MGVMSHLRTTGGDYDRGVMSEHGSSHGLIRPGLRLSRFYRHCTTVGPSVSHLSPSTQCFSNLNSVAVLTMHKTLVIDWL